MTHWFQQRDEDFELQYQTFLEETGTEPAGDREEAFLATERADRLHRHGPASGTSAYIPLPRRRPELAQEHLDELVAREALKPRSSDVTPLGVYTPEERDAA